MTKLGIEQKLGLNLVQENKESIGMNIAHSQLRDAPFVVFL